MAAAQTQAPQPNFRFRFSVRDCPTETFDSFTGLFMKGLGGGGFPPPTATTNLFLSAQQLQTISDRVTAIGFFDYPARFIGIPLGLDEVLITTPYLSYTLEVHSGERSHTVAWDDKSEPTTAAADRLRDLFSVIIQFIHDRPEYKRLPPGIMGCM